LTPAQAENFVKVALAQSRNVKEVVVVGDACVRVTVDFRYRDIAIQEKLHITEVSLKSASGGVFGLTVVPYLDSQVVESNLGVAKSSPMRVVTAIGSNPPN
jgi:hypothetical protein